MDQRKDIRAWCIIAVLFSSACSIAAIVLGILIHKRPIAPPAFLQGKCALVNLISMSFTDSEFYLIDHYALPSTRIASLLVLLLFNFALTYILDAHDIVQSIALRWLLRQESPEKPRYNTCLRLASGTNSFGPCHYTMNILAMISTAICYGATATAVSQIQVLATCTADTGSFDFISEDFDGPHWGIDFSTIPLAMLGGGLLFQNLISLWTLGLLLLKGNRSCIAWTLDPISNALDAASELTEVPRQLTVRNSYPARSAYRQVPRVRVFLRIVWVVFACLVVSVIISAYHAGEADAFNLTNIDALGDRWQFWGFSYIVFPAGSANYAGALVQSGLQGILAAAMHCGDAIIRMINDEVCWRDADQKQIEPAAAYEPRKYHIYWRTVVLFIARSIVQFIFGFAVSVDQILSVALAPLVMVATIFLLLAIMLEVMARHTPPKEVPTAYGEFKILIRCIRERHPGWLLPNLE